MIETRDNPQPLNPLEGKAAEVLTGTARLVLSGIEQTHGLSVGALAQFALPFVARYAQKIFGGSDK